MPCNKTNKKEHIDLGFNFMQYFKFLAIYSYLTISAMQFN